MATVGPGASWPGMWRVRFGGKLNDMANYSRAKDAAISLVLSELNAGRHKGTHAKNFATRPPRKRS
jgi:hypothetical protein